MPDLSTFNVSRGGAGNVNSPTWTIEAVVQQDGVTVADFTGANVIRFPAVLGTLSNEDQDDLINQIANVLVLKAAAQASGGA